MGHPLELPEWFIYAFLVLVFAAIVAVFIAWSMKLAADDSKYSFPPGSLYVPVRVRGDAPDYDPVRFALCWNTAVGLLLTRSDWGPREQLLGRLGILYAVVRPEYRWPNSAGTKGPDGKVFDVGGEIIGGALYLNHTLDVVLHELFHLAPMAVSMDPDLEHKEWTAKGLYALDQEYRVWLGKLTRGENPPAPTGTPTA